MHRSQNSFTVSIQFHPSTLINQDNLPAKSGYHMTYNDNNYTVYTTNRQSALR